MRRNFWVISGGAITGLRYVRNKKKIQLFESFVLNSVSVIWFLD